MAGRGISTLFAIALISLLTIDCTVALLLNILSTSNALISRTEPEIAPVMNGDKAQTTTATNKPTALNTQQSKMSTKAESSATPAGQSGIEVESSSTLTGLALRGVAGGEQAMRVHVRKAKRRRPVPKVCYFSPIQCVFFERL